MKADTTPRWFIAKPVKKQAVQWFPDKKMARFDAKGRYFNRRIGYDALGVEYTICDIGIRTLEGFMSINPGDWIITGLAGERYACKPDIFAATYERVSDEG
jgi:hypothetical protein